MQTIANFLWDLVNKVLRAANVSYIAHSTKKLPREHRWYAQCAAFKCKAERQCNHE
jgi:hypothetical protein